ncbi:IscS subfamily cysteine desulfurase [Shumkonia mesophila]|uniref:IscS subfamily cysteine desulfurase n=1 Tax=Shumkonia mesophila TaxID=2838854 RepID=UPI0029349917|nr:IscS subfamily cysteine desulfurase [Shumkonia mesophila]
MSKPATAAVGVAPQRRPVYLDYQATTPTDPRVVAEMLPFFTEKFGNPHSEGHAFGREAEEAVETARRQVADLIGAEAREIVFTSGATESNNLALKGLAGFYGEGRDHIVTVATEHKCVLETVRQLEREGFSATFLPVAADGLIDPAAVAATLTGRTLAVSVMAANNEIGVVQPLAEIGRICRERQVFFHTDAAQAAGEIPLNVGAMNVDLMSLTAHKMYGPMGIGALYVRRRPRVRLAPQMSGGGQERGMRSGTLPAPLCVGFGAACSLAAAGMEAESRRLGRLRDRFLDRLRARLDGVSVNGSLTARLPGNLNLGFAGIGGENPIGRLPDLALSTGSACTSASLEPSHVLTAIGVEEPLIRTAIRFSVGRTTTEEEVDYAAGRVAEEVEALRRRSPA